MKTYSPKEISIVLAGILITGFADGTFCEIEFNADAFTLYVGADGTFARARSEDQSGTIKVTLNPTAPVNDQLSALATTDRQSGNGAGAVLIKDGRGTSIASGSSAWLLKKPVKGYAKEITAVEWTIIVADLQMNVGGTTG